MSSSNTTHVAATVAPPVPSTSSHCTTPPLVDVFIVGAGPAGLMASLCSTTYGLKVMHIDDRPHPTTAGRADGIQPRTIEVLRNIGNVTAQDEPGDLDSGSAPLTGGGLAKRMIAQGVRVYEVAFWVRSRNHPARCIVLIDSSRRTLPTTKISHERRVLPRVPTSSTSSTTTPCSCTRDASSTLFSKRSKRSVATHAPRNVRLTVLSFP